MPIDPECAAFFNKKGNARIQCKMLDTNALEAGRKRSGEFSTAFSTIAVELEDPPKFRCPESLEPNQRPGVAEPVTNSIPEVT